MAFWIFVPPFKRCWLLLLLPPFQELLAAPR
jgi:hypothetical protein